MHYPPLKLSGLIIVLGLALAGCSKGPGSLGGLGSRLFGGGKSAVTASNQDIILENGGAGTPPPARPILMIQPERRGLFRRKSANPQQANSYLWNASLQVLNFLPVQSADQLSGVIQTGFGTPPGGRRAYRAIIRINGPFLDASTLTVIMHTSRGLAAAKTNRAIEDAILTRARQLRIADR